MTDYNLVMHRSAIQTVGRTVTPTTAGALDGFLSENVFDIAPAKLDTAQLPAMYSLTSQGVYKNDVAENTDTVTRIYRVQVAVVPIGQADPETRERLCQPLLERLQNAFSEYPTLGNTINVRSSKVISDSGIVILPEFGMKFVGFEMRLQVQYYIPGTFAPGE